MITTTAGLRVYEAVENAEGAGASLDLHLGDADELTLEEAAEALLHLLAARKSLQRSEAALEQHIAALFKQQGIRERTEVKGVGVVEVRYGKPRTRWDHEALAKAWMEAWLPAYQGEIPPPWDVRDALLAVAAVSYWRATPLRALGVDPDEYCETRAAQARVQITGPDRPAAVGAQP